MSSEMTIHTADYRQWLGELKTRFRQVQLKAAVAVNSAMLQFYWELGADMMTKQTQFAWGSGFLNQLSADLMREFPDVKGFSVRNLKYIRQWHEFWLSTAIGQQPVAQLAQQPVSQILSIPWGHNLAILAKCKQNDEALHYAQATCTAFGQCPLTMQTLQLVGGLSKHGSPKTVNYPFVSFPIRLERPRVSKPFGSTVIGNTWCETNKITPAMLITFITTRSSMAWHHPHLSGRTPVLVAMLQQAFIRPIGGKAT